MLPPLTRIYLEENDDDELNFIASNVMSGMFLSPNKQIQALYKKAYDKIAKSNNAKAIHNLVDDIVAKGVQYKKYNFDKVGINLLRQMVTIQKGVNMSNKNQNIETIKTGIAKLLE